MILHFYYKIDLGSWSRGSERVWGPEKRVQSCVCVKEAKKCPKVRDSLSNIASDAKALYSDIFCVLSKEPSFSLSPADSLCSDVFSYRLKKFYLRDCTPPQYQMSLSLHKCIQMEFLFLYLIQSTLLFNSLVIDSFVFCFFL